MIFNLQLKIESAKPLSGAMKEKWHEISKAISFETAAATIIYLSEILELYGNSKSSFKVISWTGPNMYWVGHDEWEISAKNLKIHRNRNYTYDSDREEVNCITDKVFITGFKKGQEIEWNGEVPTFSDNMIMVFKGIDKAMEEKIRTLTGKYFNKFIFIEVKP